MTDVLQAGRKGSPADDPGANDATAKPKKKGKLKKVIILVVVLAVVGYEAQGMVIKPHYKHGQVAPPGQILPLDQLTVNLSDGHLVQATIDLQLTAVADTKTITADTPHYDDAAIGVIGAQTYAGLLAPGGRDAFKAQLLAAFQKLAGSSEGSQEVSSVYFTGLVIQ